MYQHQPPNQETECYGNIPVVSENKMGTLESYGYDEKNLYAGQRRGMEEGGKEDLEESQIWLFQEHVT